VSSVLIHEEQLAALGSARSARLGASPVDGGDLWRLAEGGSNAAMVKRKEGKLPDSISKLKLGAGKVDVLVIASQDAKGQASIGGKPYLLQAWHIVDRKPAGKLDVVIHPSQADVFDRVRGVFETDILREKRVAVVGLGSGGSFIARELAKAGVGHFTLVDHDRLEVGNVCRHECGLEDLGRSKVYAMRDRLLGINPSASIEALPAKVDGRSMDHVGKALAGADLLICATDNRESRLLVNRMAVQQEKTVIYGAVFRRAYGGQVLRVVPKLTPCYQCFVNALPTAVEDQEISSPESAASIAYSDRPVPIEPGLSSDIVPIALQVVKMAILELLRGRETTLSHLYEDIVAPVHLWLNRREPGTDYENLAPLQNNMDEMSILRWYGIFMPRDAECPACGAYEEGVLSRHNLAPEDLDLSAFGGGASSGVQEKKPPVKKVRKPGRRKPAAGKRKK
jgi:molybdopterin/thiamine biosynthesis adenylyltransferase